MANPGLRQPGGPQGIFQWAISNDEIRSSLPVTKLISRYHFHPDIAVSLKDNIISAGPIMIKIENALDIRLQSYDYAPEFNHLVPANMLEIEFNSPLIVRIDV